MASSFRLPRCSPLFAAFFGIASTFAASPVLDDPLAAENGSSRVAANIPVGKTLVLPLTASDADGDVLGFTVASSHPKIMARVRTGLTRLRLHVSYAGDPAANPPSAAFSGDLDFVLFRDFTPLTADLIGGLSQGGYYDPRQEGTETRSHLFHRVVEDFAIQAGDPNGQLPDPALPADPLIRGPGYTFDNEFSGSLIFTGRGQLAMANGGSAQGRRISTSDERIVLGDFSATNGSQFFIAMQQPRFLDFKHTIFGQCVRGFDLLDKINAVPVTAQFANPRDTGAALENSRPTVEVQITSATVQPARSEAMLLLSATDTVAATLVVTATDPAGGKSTRSVPVRGFRDLTNDPPLLRPIPNLVSAVGVSPPLPVRAFDLERDYLLYGFASVLVTSGTQTTLETNPGSFGTARIIAPPDSFTARTTAGFQDVALGVTAFNEPLLNAQASLDNPFAPFDAYHFQKIEIGFGDRAVSEEAFPVEGEAGAVLTDVILAEFRDGDAAGSAADFAANVNWGDGSLKDVSTATTPKIRIERSTTAPGAYVVKGTHTFAKPGVYPIETVLDGRLGATSRARSQAVIALPGTPLRAVGVSVVNTGATLADRVLAKFTDTTPGVQARNFSALVDWGDGAVSPGTIVSKGAGRFAVTGRHVYRDPEAFAVFVHVSRGTAAKAVAWSRVQVSGFAAPQHLPPFQMAHLVSQISQVNGFPFLTTTGTGANVQSRFALSIVVLNSGSIASQPGKLRFYLSKNQTFNAAAIGADPADVPMMLGPFSEADLPALPAGSGLRYDLIPTTSNGTPLDLRLVAPRGRAVASYFVLAHLGYSDPIADKMPIPKDVTFPRIDGVKLNKGSLLVTEGAGASHTGTFTVVIEGPPAADVKIKVALSNTQVTTDQTELTFTSVNWATPQTVTVTAVDDTNKESITTTIITVGPSESTDASWDAMPGGTVAASVIDND